MVETFSQSQYMIEYVGSDGKLLGEQDFGGDMNSYWRKWAKAVA